MLTVGRALMGNPDVLLLDEPSEGLAPIMVQKIGDLIDTLRGVGTTIVLAEQNLHFCLGLADRAVVIDKGADVFVGTLTNSMPTPRSSNAICPFEDSVAMTSTLLSAMRQFDLSGTRILITGAAGGIGAATARLCAELGATMVLTDIDSFKLESLAHGLRGVAAAHRCDVSDRAAVEHLVAQHGPSTRWRTPLEAFVLR